MTNALELSKRASMLTKAKQDLTALANVPVCSEAEAVQIVSLMVVAYPQTPPPDPKAYMHMVVGRLTGTPLADARAMLDPRIGIVTQHAFLPSLAEIHRWLEERQAGTRAQIRQLRSVIETLKDDGPTPPPLEVRLRQIAEANAELGKRKDERKAELDAKMDERFRKQQRSVPEEGMQGLRNLDRMVPGSEDSMYRHPNMQQASELFDAVRDLIKAQPDETIRASVLSLLLFDFCATHKDPEEARDAVERVFAWLFELHDAGKLMAKPIDDEETKH